MTSAAAPSAQDVTFATGNAQSSHAEIVLADIALQRGAVILVAVLGSTPADAPAAPQDFEAAPSRSSGGAPRVPVSMDPPRTATSPRPTIAVTPTHNTSAAVATSLSEVLSAAEPGSQVPSVAQPAGTPPSPEPNTPESITIRALGVSAPVDPILATAGELLPPDDPSRAGWWQASALAGADTGTVVLIGHVDSARFGPGGLFGVTRLKAGDPLSVVTDSGRVDYRVTSRRTIPKAGGLPPGLFAVAGPPALVLITCGGPFDARTRHYRDNVVIIATPNAALR